MSLFVVSRNINLLSRLPLRQVHWLSSYKFPPSYRISCDSFESSWRQSSGSLSALRFFCISPARFTQDDHSLKKNLNNEDQTKSLTQDHANPTSSEPAKKSLFQRFKQMYKDYWYVLIPVHCVTSVFWAGGFYFAVKSGLDVVALLENLGVSEKIIGPLRNSSVGYYALTYALYKVASPARYAVTIGGTTVSINYLTKWGYIKPVPSAERLQVLYQTRTAELREKRDNFRRKLRQHKADLKKMHLSRKRAKK